MVYLKKSAALEPKTSYFVDMQVDITEFNERQKEFQDALKAKLRADGHKIIITRVTPIYKAIDGWNECEWYETGVIGGVRMYFTINPILLAVILVIAAISAAALAIGVSINMIGIGISRVIAAAGDALEPFTKMEFLIPALIGIAIIGYFFILKRKG